MLELNMFTSMKNQWAKFAVLCILYMLYTGYVMAQMQASISATQIHADESVTLTISTNQGMIRENGFTTTLDDFQVIGNSKLITNNKYQLDITFVPRRTGSLTIPSWEGSIGGKTYRTPTYKIQVSAATGARRNNQSRQTVPPGFDEEDPWEQMMKQMQDMDEAWEEMMRQQQARRRQYYEEQDEAASNQHLSDAEPAFVEVQVDRKSVYVGEPIEVSYNIYNRMGGSTAYISRLPELKGFWSKDYDIPKNPQGRRTIVGNHYYTTYLVKKSRLYPTQSGMLTLDPLEFTVEGYDGSNSKFQSKPLQIQVKPLPPAPENFKGAVGNLSLAAQLKQSAATTDDVISLLVTIRGKGNLDLIQAPELQLPEHLEAATPIVHSNASNIRDEKTFEYRISAAQAGSYTIPSLSLTYFNPAQAQYQVLNSEPIQIQITEGLGKPVQTEDTVVESGTLMPINTAALEKPAAPKSFWNTSNIVGTWLLVLLSFPFLATINKQKAKKSSAKLQARLSPDQIALQRLAAAKSLLNTDNHKGFFEEVSKSIWLYLSDTLDIPLHQLNKQVLEQKLLLKGVPTDKISETLELIKTCEIALYSPFSMISERATLLERAANLLSYFEVQLKS